MPRAREFDGFPLNLDGFPLTDRARGGLARSVMLQAGRLQRTDLAALEEADPSGYDRDLPPGADERIAADALPALSKRFPELAQAAGKWLE